MTIHPGPYRIVQGAFGLVVESPYTSVSCTCLDAISANEVCKALNVTAAIEISILQYHEEADQAPPNAASPQLEVANLRLITELLKVAAAIDPNTGMNE